MALFGGRHCYTKIISVRYCVKSLNVVRCFHLVENFLFACDYRYIIRLRYDVQVLSDRNTLDVICELELNKHLLRLFVPR